MWGAGRVVRVVRVGGKLKEWVTASIGKGADLLCLKQSAKTATVHLLGQDSRWQQMQPYYYECSPVAPYTL